MILYYALFSLFLLSFLPLNYPGLIVRSPGAILRLILFPRNKRSPYNRGTILFSCSPYHNNIKGAITSFRVNKTYNPYFNMKENRPMNGCGPTFRFRVLTQPQF